MSMGNYAQAADTIENSFVREICPDEVDNLQIALDEADIDWEHLGNSAQYGDLEGELGVDVGEDDKVQSIFNAYDKLCMKFKDKTGLSLYARYHDKEDRGDEVDGFFWEVGGVYDYTPAGKKYKDKITQKSWTVFG